MTPATNPLSSLALRLPAQTAYGAAIAGRLFGALLAVGIAFDQSYDPTQVFTLVVAAASLSSLAVRAGAVGDVAAGFGCGVLFFAGAVLTHLAPGLGMLAMGMLAGLATFAFAHASGRGTALPAVAFVAAVFATAALQVAIVFSFE